MLADVDIELIRAARHGDPFAVLGPHADRTAGCGCALSCRAPSTSTCSGPTATPVRGRLARAMPMALRRSARCSADAYRLQVRWADGATSVVDDPYRFPPVLGDLDVWLLGEGTHLRPYEVMGATQRRLHGVGGTAFAVWAPNAARSAWSATSTTGTVGAIRCAAPRVRRLGDLPARRRPGQRLQVRHRSMTGEVVALKADPYALQAELRPATASIVGALPPAAPVRPSARGANALDAPISIYEVHLGSWRRHVDGNRFLDWDELADRWCPTRATWASRTSSCCRSASTRSTARGATSRSGCTRRPRASAGRRASGASWRVPRGRAGRAARLGAGALPDDAHGLVRFDGTPLYEHADPREGFHQDWNTLIYNFGRTEVRNFLVATRCSGSSATASTACASTRWPRCSTATTAARPANGCRTSTAGARNLEAIAFLKRMNEVVGVARPQAMTSPRNRPRFPACRDRRRAAASASTSSGTWAGCTTPCST
jgi:1,4-alpha-glucan branching enzyme